MFELLPKEPRALAVVVLREFLLNAPWLRAQIKPSASIELGLFDAHVKKSEHALHALEALLASEGK